MLTEDPRTRKPARTIYTGSCICPSDLLACEGISYTIRTLVAGRGWEVQYTKIPGLAMTVSHSIALWLDKSVQRLEMVPESPAEEQEHTYYWERQAS